MDKLRQWTFTQLDWIVAWRHLRADEDRPAWVIPLLLVSLYLMAVGGVLSAHAGSLSPVLADNFLGSADGFVTFAAESDTTPTPLQGFYGTFGIVTLMAGVMVFTMAVLAVFFNLLPTVITMSVLLGCMALVVVLSLMSGLEGDLRDKILGQRAHIRVSRSDGRPFDDYQKLSQALAGGAGIAGASPYLEGEIMVRSGLNRQGAILSGVLPAQQRTVSDLPSLVEEGDYDFLTDPSSIPEPNPLSLGITDTPHSQRHLEGERKKSLKREAEPSFGTVDLLPSLLDRESDDDDDSGWDDPPTFLGETAATSKLPRKLGSLKPGSLKPDPIKPGSLRPGPIKPGSLKPDPIKPKTGRADVDAKINGLLRALPSPRRRLADLDTEFGVDDDGWEDPAQELVKLRAEGKVAAAEPEAQGSPTDVESEHGIAAGLTPESVAEAPVVVNPILIGKELAMELGVGTGSQLQLITPVGRMTPAGHMPGMLASKVAGVFYSGMYEYDRKNVYVPLRVAQRFLLAGDRISGIEIKLDDVDALGPGKLEVERIVAQLGRDQELVVEDWRDLNRNLFSAMFLEKVAMFIALLFVVLVASFGILASNLMSVMEKSKEIAILKTMGADDAAIMRIFVAEGLCVGLLGSGAGIAMGLALTWVLDTFGLPLNENVYYIQKLPVVTNPYEVALVGGAALVIVCLSSIYPALVAAWLRPVDALRQGEH